ncbi:MAG: AGE family epimerase/isomerase [Silicimonas sp.]|nr:AGE family epimerase/isomerase [Silicimonas sp.]
MSEHTTPGPEGAPGFWLENDAHRAYLAEDARAQFRFFQATMDHGPGFAALDHDGGALPGNEQGLVWTARLVHSYALGHLWGEPDCWPVIDRGMALLRDGLRDDAHGGWFWSLKGDEIGDDRKLAYGHVFVLLAGSTAKEAGHPDADALIAEAREVLDARFWDEDAGRFREEYNRDWSPLSTYRGMNSNMHGTEALLAAYEATGDRVYLDRAGRILSFFVGRMAAGNGWRIPEHYTDDWQVDPTYSGDTMFRPAGTTPGHSFELGRLALHWWDLAERPDDGTPERARRLIEQALEDGWRDPGGIAYTLDLDGKIDVSDRYWWPLTEAISALATLIKLERRATDEAWYRRLWAFADSHFVDHARGGWYPELAEDGGLADVQFKGKPDIYHSVQACLFPLAPGVSRYADGLRKLG